MNGLIVLSALLMAAEPRQEPKAPTPWGVEATPAYVFGGLMIALGGGARAFGTRIALSRSFDPLGRDGTYARVVGGALALGGLGLTGHASYVRGVQSARRPRLRPAVGWTLFGVGAAVVAASRFVPLACFETPCAVVTGEVSTWGGFALAGVGLNLATFSLGARRSVALAPTASGSGAQRIVGLTVSGRF